MKNRIVTSLFVILSVVALVTVMLDSLGRTLFPGSPDAKLTGEEPRAGRDTFCVMTYNIAHGRGRMLHQVLVGRKTMERNLGALAEYVKAVSPDVVGLQEVDKDCDWSANVDQAAFIAEKMDWPHFRFGLNNVNQGRYKLNYGNAVVSPHAIISFENYPFGKASLGEKGFLVADIEVNGKVVAFVVAHLDFRTANTRRRQVEKMIEVLGEVEKPLVVMGDFNCDLTGGEDSLRLLVEGLDLKTWEFEGKTGATFPSVKPKTRIDYILISDELEFVGYESPDKHLTDHLPVIAVIKFKKQ